MGKQKTYQPFYRDLIRTIWGYFIGDLTGE
jgi:hypothetical protein